MFHQVCHTWGPAPNHPPALHFLPPSFTRCTFFSISDPHCSGVDPPDSSSLSLGLLKYGPQTRSHLRTWKLFRQPPGCLWWTDWQCICSVSPGFTFLKDPIFMLSLWFSPFRGSRCLKDNISTFLNELFPKRPLPAFSASPSAVPRGRVLCSRADQLLDVRPWGREESNEIFT